MLGDVILTASGIFSGWHNANELHHSSIFVREDVAVQYVGAGKIQIGLPDRYPAGCHICNLAGGVRADLRRWDCDSILPDKVVGRCVHVVRVPCSWRSDPDHLKWIDVNVKRVGQGRPILKHPVL